MRGWGRGGAPYGNKGRFVRERDPLWQTQIRERGAGATYDSIASGHTYEDADTSFEGTQVSP